MEHLDIQQVALYRRECLLHQLRILVPARAVPDDLPGAQVRQQADIGPSLPDPDIGQVADDIGAGNMTTDVPGQEVGRVGFIAFRRVDPILISGVCRYQTAFPHDPADPAPGYHQALAMQHTLQFSLPVHMPILIICELYRFFQFPVVLASLAFVVICASRNAKAPAKR